MRSITIGHLHRRLQALGDVARLFVVPFLRCSFLLRRVIRHGRSGLNGQLYCNGKCQRNSTRGLRGRGNLSGRTRTYRTMMTPGLKGGFTLQLRRPRSICPRVYLETSGPHGSYNCLRYGEWITRSVLSRGRRDVVCGRYCAT